MLPKLTGPQIKELQEALLDAFDEQGFKEFLRIQLDRKLEHLTPRDKFPTELFNVIEAADQDDWAEDLLRAARLWRPTNMKLLMFAGQFGLAPIIPTEPELNSVFERKVRPSSKMIDPAIWREKMERIEGQVCRVEVRNKGESTFGTGFLLGSDVVITNYHVVEDAIKGIIKPEHVIFLFDFKKTIDTTLPGIPYYLAEQDWCIDYSEPSPLDELSEPWDQSPAEDMLDYALMRLSTQAGKESVGGKTNKNPKAFSRGWIEVSPIESKLLPDLELFIMQHTDGDRLQLAPETHSIICTNVNNTRVFYRTYTDEGSSGGSCFNLDWQLIALHQGGDKRDHPEYNQGIPFSAIVTLLKKRGKLDALGISHNNEPLSNHSFEASSSKQESGNKEEHPENLVTNELLPYEQACQYFQEACVCLQKAHTPLQEGLHIPAPIFRASTQYLQEMQTLIQRIIEHLQGPCLLPLDIAKERSIIIHELRIIDGYITHPLLSLLSHNKFANFTAIQNLMQIINKRLLPDHSKPISGGIIEGENTVS